MSSAEPDFNGDKPANEHRPPKYNSLALIAAVLVVLSAATFVMWQAGMIPSPRQTAKDEPVSGPQQALAKTDDLEEKRKATEAEAERQRVAALAKDEADRKAEEDRKREAATSKQTAEQRRKEDERKAPEERQRIAMLAKQAAEERDRQAREEDERARLAAIAKKAEERKADEERQRIAALAKADAERRRKEDERKAEEERQRQAAAAREADEQKRKEDERRAEEERQRQALIARQAEEEQRKEEARKAAEELGRDAKARTRREAGYGDPSKGDPAVSGSIPRRVERYPLIEAPDNVQVGKEFPVTINLKLLRTEREKATQKRVSVQAGRTTKQQSDGKLSFVAPARDELEIDVDLSAENFTERSGEWTRKLILPVDGDADPVRFVMVANSAADTSEERWISARLFLEGRLIANLSRPIRVGAPPPEVVNRADQLTAPSATPRAKNEKSGSPLTVVRLRRDDTAAPDLDILIEYANPKALGPGRLTIRSPHIAGPISTAIDTPAEITEWLDNEYKRMVDLGIKATKDTSTSSVVASNVDAVRAIGRVLYDEYVPQALKDVVGQLEKADKLQSIQITSNSPVIPWELVYKSEFWGAKYRIARWALRRSAGQLDDPVKAIAFKELHTIAPVYRGTDYLGFQATELAILKRAAGFKLYDGHYAGVKALLGQPIAGIVHFTGHGEYNDVAVGRSVFGIRLLDATVDPSTWSMMTPAGMAGAPLLFFNACDTGRAKSFGGFVQGWGTTILSTGAGGFIGGQWPLVDRSAADASAVFYSALENAERKPVYVSEVLQQVRKQFYETGDPTFLSYAFFGDVNLQVAP